MYCMYILCRYEVIFTVRTANHGSRELCLNLSESNVIKTYYIDMESDHTWKMYEQLNVHFEFAKMWKCEG